jgi:hypothetical protein
MRGARVLFVTLPVVTSKAAVTHVRYAESACVSALQAADARRTNSATGVEHSLEGMGGLYYATYEAHFEGKASEGSRTGGRCRRHVFVAGERRVRSNRYADGGYAVAEPRPAPNHSQ